MKIKLCFIFIETNGRKPKQRLFDLKRALPIGKATSELDTYFNVRLHQNGPNVYLVKKSIAKRKRSNATVTLDTYFNVRLH